ncbi:PaaI family thioesterase [Thioclava sp. A2]|uniref:PaaI family thioesterase n=1 Tax=Thioclava sp. FCG-A2 TaxID=3080562 RepID=UPI002953631D|nr:PaaI family thioesterase [Thioclava sp. A2]MDV7271531.1 PaaI family thioesterase [Thioclava sp. A2]
MAKFAQSPADFMTLDALKEISGLEFMQKIVAGELPTTTLARLMNYEITSAEEGRVEVLGRPEFEHTNAYGGIHGGWYGTIMDTCMTCAVMTGLKAGQYQTTLEYKVNMIRAIPTGAQVRAIGTLEHLGRSTGVARGEIRGVEDGRLYATGTTTCFIMGTPN